jgi:glycosyltransferase involved in cell wall biosynthesis
LLVSRLTPLKRADLLIAALAHAEGRGVRCIVAGEGDERASLEKLAHERGVADRVRFTGRVTDDQLVELLARCRAVCFPPYQEDYGFVTVEAFASHKAVVTCSDSGGPAELVTDQLSGFVCDPRPESIARALRTLAEDTALAERMGQQAFEAGGRLTWADAIRQLVLE